MRTDSRCAGRQVADVLAAAAAVGRSVLLEPEVYELLAAAGIGVPAHRWLHARPGAAPDPVVVDEPLCRSLRSEEAVVKVVSPDLLHKSDVGGVRICPNRPEAIRQAVAEVLENARRAAPRARIEGTLAVERVRFEPGTGREILASFRHDPAFGPVVVLGVGGLDTEILLQSLRPRAARAMLAAEGLDRAAAVAALRGTLVHAAFTGALRSSRGQGHDETALADLAVSLGRLAAQWAGFAPPGGLGLSELELNPLVAAGDGRLLAIDGLARLHRPASPPPARPIQELRRLLRPASALVVGASAEAVNPGRVILRNLLEGGGVPRERVWALHPKAEAIDGCRAFASLRELPEPVDLAVVSVAADRAEAVIGEILATRSARSVTLIAGGFGETERGRETEARLRAALAESHRAQDGGVLLNGGNCLGIISAPGGYNTFFIPRHKLRIDVGGGAAAGRPAVLASISQSGAYLVTQISNLEGGVAPRYAISFGNQMDVTVADYLEHLAADAGARVFAVYLEGFQPGDGARFLQAARRIRDSGRPVLLYKAGRSREGSAAAASHTASAVGDYEVCEALMDAAGVCVASSLDQFEDDIVTCTLLDGRRPEGRRVAVLSNAGFEATAAADSLGGLTLARLGPATVERLAALLPPGLVDVHNPADATPITPTDRYADLARAMADDPQVDAVVVGGVPATPAFDSLAKGGGHREDASGPSGLATQLTEMFRATGKPVVFSVDAGELYDPLVAAMRRNGLPTFRRIDRATRALARYLSSTPPRCARP